MAGEEQGHEHGSTEGAGDEYNPDQPFEAPGGAMTTPGLEEADWGELADAVRSHGEIPDDLDVGGDQSTDAGPDGPDGQDEMMAAWRAAQRETGDPTPEEEGDEAVEGVENNGVADAIAAVEAALADRRDRGLDQHDPTAPIIDLRTTDGGGAAKLDIAGVPEPPRASENPKDE